MQRTIKNNWIVIFYIVVCFIWGTTWIAIKSAVETIPPLTSAGLRFLIAFPFLLSILKLKKQSLFYQNNKKMLFVFVTVCYFCIPYFLLNFGERFVSSGFTAILFSTVSIFMILFSIIINRTKVPINQLFGVILGFIFLILIILEKQQTFSETNILGICAILGAAICHSLSYVVIKKYGFEINVLTLNTLPMGIGGLLLLLLGILIEKPDVSSFSYSSIFAILYLAIVASVIGFALYFYLLKRMNTVMLSYVFIFFPVIAVSISLLIENEILSYKFFILFLGLLGAFTLTKIKIPT
ncbi:DMT family transporter [Nostocaceae cyanobacterium CENA357]|uniref:DMT family transporter n=1 Tax=Atlanticothrix silvestris CENA357 TaxID=1725252 RepID=A0A8J7HLG9_9CYAN|nr:DMT family transporter [Atlanticothrix silvestris]MBH8554958.1 DMT family transporter [Atlanticothrix silvestris CENA357]